MDTREWEERFDRLKPDERHMAYLAMLSIVGVSADEALDCQTIKPDAFKTLHFKKPKFEWPHITLALPIDPESWYPPEHARFRYIPVKQRDELRDAILALKELDLYDSDKEDE